MMEAVKEKVELQRYPEYKDSGIEWLGTLPSHWKIEKGKWLFKEEDRPTREEDEVVTCFRDGEVTLRANRRTDGFTNSLKEHGYQGIRKGDLVIHNMDAFAGAIGVSDSDGKSTPVYSACTPLNQNEVSPEYYAYFLRDLALSGFIESLAKGIRERSTDFRFSNFGELLLAMPTYEEQTAIAHFLDRKTEQIDQAIEIKQKQIELLKERRQILIHKAVTRGLNPEAPLKPSGVDWIGDIPEHWEVKRLRYLGRTQNGVSKGAEYFGKGHPFISYGDVYNNIELPQEVDGLADSNKSEQKLYSVKKGDIFFTRTSESVEEIGIASTCMKSIDKAVFSGFLIRFRPTTDLLEEEYSKYYFCSELLRIFLIKEMNLVIRASLSQDLLKKLPVLIPPKKEQLLIGNYLDEVYKKTGRLISNKFNEIERLKEYKTTLINSAVTGKIKVS